MPAKRASMRKIRECLRLKFACALPHEQIARALGLSKGVVTKYLQRATQAGLNWAMAAHCRMPRSRIKARLLLSRPVPTAQRRVMPDWATVHRELRRKGVTFQLLWTEYVEAHACRPTYRYTQFCQHYHDYDAFMDVAPSPSALPIFSSPGGRTRRRAARWRK